MIRGAHIGAPGGDSALPQPEHYSLAEIWAFYVGLEHETPHVWTQAEVLALGRGGVKACLPIVVPPQAFPLAPHGTEAMADVANGWGVPMGSPLVWDMERSFSDQASPDELLRYGIAWVVSCAKYRYQPIIYCDPLVAGGPLHPNNGYVGRTWVVDLSTPPGDLPAGAMGHQYGQTPDGSVDLDVFADGVYMTPGLGLVNMVGSDPVPVPPGPKPKPPLPTEPDPLAWVVKSTSGRLWLVDVGFSGRTEILEPYIADELVRNGYDWLGLSNAQLAAIPDRTVRPR